MKTLNLKFLLIGIFMLSIFTSVFLVSCSDELNELPEEEIILDNAERAILDIETGNKIYYLSQVFSEIPNAPSLSETISLKQEENGQFSINKDKFETALEEDSELGEFLVEELDNYLNESSGKTQENQEFIDREIGCGSVDCMDEYVDKAKKKWYCCQVCYYAPPIFYNTWARKCKKRKKFGAKVWCFFIEVNCEFSNSCNRTLDQQKCNDHPVVPTCN